MPDVPDVDKIQKFAAWILGMPVGFKLVTSFTIGVVAATLIVLIWLPPPEPAITEILSKCYRRALFTKTHAEAGMEAMFDSIAECHSLLQSKINDIHSSSLSSTATELAVTLDAILHMRPSLKKNGFLANPQEQHIDRLKLRAIDLLRALARDTGGKYELPRPESLLPDTYFSKDEVDRAPSPEEIRKAQPALLVTTSN